MPDTKAPTPPATNDQLIRDLRALIERRGWVATGSSTESDGSIVITARPKQAGE